MKRLIMVKWVGFFGTRKKEHQDETEGMRERKFTRATRKDSLSKQMKSSIADHVANDKPPHKLGGI